MYSNTSKKNNVLSSTFTTTNNNTIYLKSNIHRDTSVRDTIINRDHNRYNNINIVVFSQYRQYLCK